MAGPGLSSMSNEFGVANNNVYTTGKASKGRHRRRPTPLTADSVPPLDGYSVISELSMLIKPSQMTSKYEASVYMPVSSFINLQSLLVQST